MRSLVFPIILMLCGFLSYAVNETSIGKIFISVDLPDNCDIPSEAARQLELKLNQLLMQNGIANDDQNNRFAITSKVSILTKDIVAGPPQKVSLNLDFTFIVGNVAENKKFESVTISSIGVGINENKAFIAAIKNIKPGNKVLVEFIAKAKDKIEEYYSLRCDQIQKEATQEAAMRNFDRAVYLLMQIPDVCPCYDECVEMAVQFSQDCLNDKAAQLFNKASSLWSANPNASGASAVADIIEQIPANSSSQSKLDRLVAEINNKLKSDQKMEWNFKMRKYKDRMEKQKRDDEAHLEQQRADNIYRDKQQDTDNKHRSEQQRANNEFRNRQQIADNAYRQSQQLANNEARKQYIEAARQICLTYAKNQNRTESYKRSVSIRRSTYCKG